MSSTKISLTAIRDITKPLVSKIPSSLKGLEYHSAIGEMLGTLDDSQRVELKDAMETFLLYMKKMKHLILILVEPDVTVRFGIANLVRNLL